MKNEKDWLQSQNETESQQKNNNQKHFAINSDSLLQTEKSLIVVSFLPLLLTASYNRSIHFHRV